jgi:DNA-binding phage protein
METTIYEDQARMLIAEIKQIVEVKGINLDEALNEAGISSETVDKVLHQEVIPSLPEFLALCRISGITIHLPAIETPNTAM